MVKPKTLPAALIQNDELRKQLAAAQAELVKVKAAKAEDEDEDKPEGEDDEEKPDEEEDDEDKPEGEDEDKDKPNEEDDEEEPKGKTLALIAQALGLKKSKPAAKSKKSEPGLSLKLQIAETKLEIANLTIAAQAKTISGLKAHEATFEKRVNAAAARIVAGTGAAPVKAIPGGSGEEEKGKRLEGIKAAEASFAKQIENIR